MSLLAGFLLILAGIAWANRARAAQTIMDAATMSQAAAERAVFQQAVACLVLGLVFAASAWFLPRHHAWARWLGLAASGVVTLIVLFGAIAGGGISPFSLLVLLLALTAVATLVSRTTSSWVPRLRAVR
jgi:hypothetical protein